MISRIAVIFILFSLFSCEKEHLGDCFNSTGSTKVNYRNVENYTKIELDDRIDLDLIWDSTNSISVKAGSRIIDNVITKVVDGELKIYNANKCNWVRSFKKQIKVTVRGNKWNTITYRGSGNINSLNTIKTDSIFLDCWEASGDIYLSIDCKASYLKSHTGPTVINALGNSAFSYLYLAANGEIDTKGLTAARNNVINQNQGNIYINTTNQLDAIIDGNGNIYEFGTPSIVNLNRRGKGNLIRR